MKQITAKQFVILAFLVIIAQKMFMLPSLITKFSGRDSYLSIAIFILIEIGALLLIMGTVKLSKDRTFYGVLDRAATKIGGKIIVAIMLLYLFIKILLLFSELRVFFNNSLSEPLQDWLAFIPLCFLLFLLGTKSLRGIGRFAEILVLFVAGAMVLLILLVAANIDFSLLSPFLENGITPVLKNVFYFPMWFGDLSLLMIALGDVEFNNKKREKNKEAEQTATGKHFLKIGTLAALTGGVLALFFCTALFACYGDMSDLIDYSHNISNMLLYSSSSYIYGRFDVPIFCVWIFSVLIELSLVFYSLTRHVSYITEYKNNKVISFAAALCAYLAFIIFFKSDYVLINFSTSWIRIFAAFNIIFVPLLLFFGSLNLRRKDKLLKDKLITGVITK